MSIFKRFERIAKANIYHMSGNTGNSEKTQKLILKKLNRELRDKKSASDAAFARLRMLESKILEYEENITEWKSIAADADASGRTELVKDAERKQADLLPVLEDFKLRFEMQKYEADRLNEDGRNLRRRIDEIRSGTSGFFGEAAFDQRLSKIDKEMNG